MKILAIMKGVDYGCRDVGRPVLWFSTHDGRGGGALQILEQKEAFALIKQSGVRSIRNLEGKACWVESDGHTQVFAGLADVP